MARTHPLGRGSDNTGSEARSGWKLNLQPKLRADALKNDAVTIGLEREGRGHQSGTK
jgi:hypothetical protein